MTLPYDTPAAKLPPPPPLADLAPAATSIISARGIAKFFRMGDETVHVLKACDFDLATGEFVAIEGRSGSGKSTLLHLLGCLDRPNGGSLAYAGLPGRDLAKLGDAPRAKLRNEDFGFVFQFYHLLPELNVLENTMLAAIVMHSVKDWLTFRNPTKLRAKELLEQVGLSHRLNHRPNQLSGGERQRVAIARALMNAPKVLFADEPTGNLDAETGRTIMDLLEALHRDHVQTIVMVTHDRALAREADRVLVLKDGKLSPA
jgi:lipoprotein-releasing system ATP-binding protein